MDDPTAPPAPPEPAARPGAAIDAAVIIPVKSFAQAKVRLTPSLDAQARSRLARVMAERVVAAAAPLPVVVVCDDDDVAEWAGDAGATVVWTPGLGLNGAVEAGVAHLATAGFVRAVVAHADLPLAHDLARLVQPDRADVVLVPDRHDDGTNVVVVPTTSGFRFAYGPGSFAKHQSEAARCGLRVEVWRDVELGWDVDVPDDLVVVADLTRRVTLAEP